MIFAACAGQLRMIFVVCNGHRNYTGRRLWPLRVGGVVIMRCELCNIVWWQRWARWELSSERLNAPTTANVRSTNRRH